MKCSTLVYMQVHHILQLAPQKLYGLQRLQILIMCFGVTCDPQHSVSTTNTITKQE